MFWKRWNGADWVLAIILAIILAATAVLAVGVVVDVVQHPKEYQDTPPPGWHRVCETIFVPITTGKTIVVVPEQSCHNEPDPTSIPTK